MDSSKLIFLISQPRSGSSMLQQLLLQNEKISSSPESWQMIQLVYTFKLQENKVGYNPKQASINFNRFLDEQPGGLKNFKSLIRNTSLTLYKDRTQDSNYFLDKTPRYYHIIDELKELFPNAKFIFLTRNPLAVFASILDYNFKGNYCSFLNSEDRQHDLLMAPQRIGEAIQNTNFYVRYEDIIENPQRELKRIFEFLEIEMEKGDISAYKLDEQFKESKAVDAKSLGSHQKPVSDYLESWKKSIDTTQKKRLAKEYLIKLKKVGAYNNVYNIDDIINDLHAHTHVKKSYFNLSFDYLTLQDKDLSIPQIIKKRLYLKLGHSHKS
jgi:hypothetical protein